MKILGCTHLKRRLTHEDYTLKGKLAPLEGDLIERICLFCPFSFSHVRTQQEDFHQLSNAGTWILAFAIQEVWENKFLFLINHIIKYSLIYPYKIHSWVFVIAPGDEDTHTHTHREHTHTHILGSAILVAPANTVPYIQRFIRHVSINRKSMQSDL